MYDKTYADEDNNRGNNRQQTRPAKLWEWGWAHGLMSTAHCTHTPIALDSSINNHYTLGTIKTYGVAGTLLQRYTLVIGISRYALVSRLRKPLTHISSWSW